MEQFIPIIGDISGAAIDLLYALDFKNNRLVQFDQDGKFIRSIGGLGRGPGDFLSPQQNIFTTNNHMYIADNYGQRLQLFDLTGKYIRSISNASAEGGLFSIGKRGLILSAPAAIDTTPMSYKILIQDSLGNDIGKMGRISKMMEDFLKKDEDNFTREKYIILLQMRIPKIYTVFFGFIPLFKDMIMTWRSLKKSN